MDELEGTLSTNEGEFIISIKRAEADEQPPATKREPRVNFPKTTRDRLLRIQDHRCGICRGPLSFFESHIDHVIPVMAGGSDDFNNLQLVHMNCNLRKGAGRSPHNPDQERLPWA